MLALALATALIAQDDPPRLRTLCPNGAAVIVERMPKEPMISVQLWSSARLVRENKAQHGYRHLLEHLLVRGDGQLDRKLETAGCYLRARTFRDAMQIEINVGPRQLDLAIQALNGFLKPLIVDQVRIDREIRVMREEFATYDDASRLSAGAWKQAFGDQGLDPFGDLEVLAKATPEDLAAIQRKEFYSENLVLSIAGPVDIKEATRLGTSLIGIKQGSTRATEADLPTGVPGRIEVDGFGEGRAAIVAGYDRPLTAGALAMALSVASEVDGSFVTYTPSDRQGMITVGQTERQSGVGLKLDSLQEQDLVLHFIRGKIMAKNWVNGFLRTAQGTAYLRGLLLVQGHGNRPESLLTSLDNLTMNQFRASAALFSKSNAVTVVGR